MADSGEQQPPQQPGGDGTDASLGPQQASVVDPPEQGSTNAAPATVTQSQAEEAASTLSALAFEGSSRSLLTPHPGAPASDEATMAAAPSSEENMDRSDFLSTPPAMPGLESPVPQLDPLFASLGSPGDFLRGGANYPSPHQGIGPPRDDSHSFACLQLGLAMEKEQAAKFAKQGNNS